MKEKLKEIAYWLEDKLKDLCGEITPDKRIVVILIMLLILTIGNLYFTFSTIYDWGKESERKQWQEIEHINHLELEKDKNETGDFMDSGIDKDPFGLNREETEQDSIDSMYKY